MGMPGSPTGKVGDYAFWKYDQYPFLLGGEVVLILDNGHTSIRGYDGMYVVPLRFLPADEGAALCATLRRLATEHGADKRRFDQEWMDRVYDAVPFGIGR